MKDQEARRVYADIIDLPHHRSPRHPPMSLQDRSAQFAPFAALTGYNAMVDEEARLTEGRPELSEDEGERLNRSLACLSALLSSGEQPRVQVVHFVPDERKSGGHFETVAGQVKRLDPLGRRMVFLGKNGISDGRAISIDALTQIRIPAQEGADEPI